MGLSDILDRIATDASDESQRLLDEASQRAEMTVSEARQAAGAERNRIIEKARRDASSHAATVVASARLAARDRALSARRELVGEAMGRVVSAIEELDGERYVRLLALGVTSSARAGDTIAVAEADQAHRDALRATVESQMPSVDLIWADQPADVKRGVVVSGQRTHLEVTPASIVAQRSDEFELAIANELFGREER